MSSVLAVNALEYLIKNQLLTSQVDDYINSIRANPNSLYSHTKAEKGIEEAEVELSETVKERHLREFAECLLPVARGMHAVAKQDSKNVHTFYIHELNRRRTSMPSPYFMSSPYIQGNASRVIVINPGLKPCSCSLPLGSLVFEPSMALKLTALMFTYDLNNGLNAELGLAFSVKQGEKMCVITFDREGGHNIYVITPTISQRNFTLSQLGIERNPIELSSYMGGSIQAALGFPGAEEYLVRHVGFLGTYLTEVARRLGEQEHR